MRLLFILLCSLLVYSSCKTPGGLFKKQTAHEAYGSRLTNAGLTTTALGTNWFSAASQALEAPISAALPLRENGYFSAATPDATGYRFSAKRGEQLLISLTKNPATGFQLFVDLYRENNNELNRVESLDSVNLSLQYTVKETGSFLLRVQPELLKSGAYALEIKTGPSLAYPVPSPGKRNGVISVWGDGRDAGKRKHEGIDIGGSRGTPLVAVGDGQVSRVTTNNLGGKVVFIQSAESRETWYYAHLDSQLVSTGQRVTTGDTIGLMGNTGNARTTAPHLHFGIYALGGAVDPLPYLNPVRKEPAPITASVDPLGKLMRIKGKQVQTFLSPDGQVAEKLSFQSPITVAGATKNLYRAKLPDGAVRYIAAAQVETLENRLQRKKITAPLQLTDQPHTGAPVIRELPAGQEVDILAVYENFQLVQAGSQRGWIMQQ